MRWKILTTLSLLLVGSAASEAADPRDLLPGVKVWKGEDVDAGSPSSKESKKASTTAKSAAPSASEASPRPRPVPGTARTIDLGTADGKRVVVIAVEGTIDLGLAPFIKRVVKESEAAGDVAALLLEVNTFGGRVDGAVQIRDALLGTSLPTVAFIHRRAISAGALISYACKLIFVSKGSTMGAATPVTVGGGKAEPVSEKVVSYMRKEMRATAEAHGRNGDVAEAMVDAEVEVEGVSEKGKLLTLTTKEGIELGVFDGQLETKHAVLEAINGQGARLEPAQVNWAERVARWLTDPTVSGMLMTIGFLGLLMELYTAGFGIAGVFGISCLFLFFLGHVVTDLAGLEELMLFAAGAAFVGAELFGLGGGLGLLGLLGGSLMVTALVLSLIEAPLQLSWDLGLLSDALTRVALAMTATTLGALAMGRFFPGSRLGQKFVLEAGLAGSTAASVDVGDAGEELVGAEGVAVTALRPFGKAMIDGRRIEVCSESAFVDSGCPLVVVKVDGRNVIVREVS